MVCILRSVKLQLEGGQNTAGRSECLQTEACSLDSSGDPLRSVAVVQGWILSLDSNLSAPGCLAGPQPQPAARICSLDSAAAATRVGRRVGLRRRSMVLRRRVRRSAGEAAAMRRRIVPGIAAAAAGVGGGCRGARRNLRVANILTAARMLSGALRACVRSGSGRHGDDRCEHARRLQCQPIGT